MQEIVKRIDELIRICTSYVGSGDYAKIIFEIKDLIVELFGSNSIYLNQFNAVVKSDKCFDEKAKFITGILSGVKNSLKLSFNEKRYQVFISSTYQDLKEYRKTVSDEIVFRGHVAAGMEDFTACGEDLETYIKRVIDESDYYILIIGQRWGTVLPNNNNMSYTMMEYNYAKSKGMRIIPMIYNGTKELEGNDLEFNKTKLDKFISEISKTVPQYFKTENELIRKVTKALDNEIKNHPQRGWIRL